MNQELINRLPSLKGRTKAELLEILQREEFGYLPPAPLSVTAEEIKRDKRFFGGKAHLISLRLCVKADFGEFAFPVYYTLPMKTEKPVPAFIHVNFTDLVPDKYQPTEEIVDQGYATLTFCYKDVTSDDGDYKNGLAGVLYPDGEPEGERMGKIAMWAWAAMRVMDYAMTLPELDHGRISVVGHSRLGKTALLAGAMDERFYCAFSNDSGCGGAAIARENTGERVADICKLFPYWFCRKYHTFAQNEESMPYDQHFLLAANYPNRVYVASGIEDTWACPPNEFLACVAAGEYYREQGSVGFIHEGDFPATEHPLHEGRIAYHVREGSHFLSRRDWNYFIQYLNAQK